MDTRTLQRLVAATPVGEELPLTVLRGGEGRQRVSVRVGVMPEAAAADRVAIEFGFLVRDPEGQAEGGIDLLFGRFDLFAQRRLAGTQYYQVGRQLQIVYVI